MNTNYIMRVPTIRLEDMSFDGAKHQYLLKFTSGHFLDVHQGRIPLWELTFTAPNGNTHTIPCMYATTCLEEFNQWIKQNECNEEMQMESFFDGFIFNDLPIDQVDPKDITYLYLRVVYKFNAQLYEYWSTASNTAATIEARCKAYYVLEQRICSDNGKGRADYPNATSVMTYLYHTFDSASQEALDLYLIQYGDIEHRHTYVEHKLNASHGKYVIATYDGKRRAKNRYRLIEQLNSKVANYNALLEQLNAGKSICSELYR